MQKYSNKKTIAENIDEGKKVEVQIDFTYNGNEVSEKVIVDEDGTGDWQIFNPTQGWCNNYYAGWSYHEADKNIEADQEQILVESIRYGENQMHIEEVMYDSCDGEESELRLETNTDNESLFELKEAPESINVNMKVTFAIIGDDDE